MSTIDERITKKMENLEQLKRQKKAQEAREKKKKETIDRERQRIIGKIVSDIFPEVLHFQPSRVKANNKIEFAPLVNFLTELASDKELISQLKLKALQKSSSLNQHEPEMYHTSHTTDL